MVEVSKVKDDIIHDNQLNTGMKNDRESIMILSSLVSSK